MSSTPRITEIIYEISHLDDRSVERWMVKGLTSLTPEMLDKAIREWQDPLLLAEYLNLENPLVKLVAKTLLKRYWETVDATLSDPWELYNQIAKDPVKKKLLDTPRGRQWISYVRKRCYEYYYNYAWGKKK